MLDKQHGEVMEALGNILEKLDVQNEGEDNAFDCEACIEAGMQMCVFGDEENVGDGEEEKQCGHVHDDKCGYDDEKNDDDKTQVKSVYVEDDEDDEDEEDEDYYEGLEWDNEGFTTDEDDEY